MLAYRYVDADIVAVLRAVMRNFPLVRLPASANETQNSPTIWPSENAPASDGCAGSSVQWNQASKLADVRAAPMPPQSFRVLVTVNGSARPLNPAEKSAGGRAAGGPPTKALAT